MEVTYLLILQLVWHFSSFLICYSTVSVVQNWELWYIRQQKQDFGYLHFFHRPNIMTKHLITEEKAVIVHLHKSNKSHTERQGTPEKVSGQPSLIGRRMWSQDRGDQESLLRKVEEPASTRPYTTVTSPANNWLMERFRWCSGSPMYCETDIDQVWAERLQDQRLIENH